MMSLAARELRRRHWAADVRGRAPDEAGIALPRFALRLLRATGFRLDGLRP
ncbi:hypothetical protein [Parasulfuritortus cantonensis]|uniref:hypothetical protein n=1 Tax=Parasulfuritortus cantonensis TaxID=2528202 RepID=UPI001404B57E|nr:hypothetical protein [Parasulfuritortus cantonensis]